MRFGIRHFTISLQVVAFVVALLSLGACSRSNLTDSLTAPGHGVAQQTKNGNRKPPPPPAPPPVVLDPCVSMTGFGGSTVATSASVPQFRTTRLRVDLVGDVTQGTLVKVQSCALGAASAVTFASGTVTVSGAGTFTFGALAAPVVEAGTVLAIDAAGNTVQIIWPAIATPLAPGPPILRTNLANSSVFRAGDTIDATISVVARAPNGTTATITATGLKMVVPPLKI